MYFYLIIMYFYRVTTIFGLNYRLENVLKNQHACSCSFLIWFTYTAKVLDSVLQIYTIFLLIFSLWVFVPDVFNASKAPAAAVREHTRSSQNDILPGCMMNRIIVLR